MLLEQRRGRPRLQPRQGDENVRAYPQPRPGRGDAAGIRADNGSVTSSRREDENEPFAVDGYSTEFRQKALAEERLAVWRGDACGDISDHVFEPLGC